MIKVNVTKEYTYFFEDQEEELIQNYMKENKVDALNAIKDLFNSSELDLDTCLYKEKGDIIIDAAEKI